MKKMKFNPRPKLKKKLSVFMALAIAVCQIFNIIPIAQAAYV